jgi:demethylmenaquinone methyltransferase/2-methoxy-6-polyprenyl-1,4-benzoquinol methylase
MPEPSDLLTYYVARANEYENVYAKPERQADLRLLHTLVSHALAGRRILEVACGTGYWTRLLATSAAAITACDLSPEVLAIARARQPSALPVDFCVGDAFALEQIPGTFDGSFIGFWWSHVQRAELPRFLTGLHRRLSNGGRVLIIDNRYVSGSNWPITRTDEHGNTYQHRSLEGGTEYEVLKNFPLPSDVRDTIAAAGGTDVLTNELEYYWYATYDVASAG